MEQSVHRATILPATDNVPSYEITVENDLYSRPTERRNTDRSSRSCPGRNRCYRIRVTLIFCGVIMLLFGISLLTTFSRTQEYDVELTPTDKKFWDSMRLTGILLLSSGCLTLIVGLSAIKCKILCNVTKRMRSSSNETERDTGMFHDTRTSVPTSSERSELNIFGLFMRRLRLNWSQQSEWSRGRTQRTDVEIRSPWNGNRFPDAPPEYLEIISQDLQRDVTIPPPPYA